MCGVGKGVGKNSARDFDIYLLASNVGLSKCQSVDIVHARASSLYVSTLWVHQAIISSLPVQHHSNVEFVHKILSTVFFPFNLIHRGTGVSY